MSDSVVVVTGCTSGLGYHATASLVSSGRTVVLACRNVAAAEKAATQLAKSTGAPRERLLVLPVALDLTRLASVRDYAAALRSLLGKRGISSLVLNAGIGAQLKYTHTADGYETVWATNHLGHTLLALLLLPQLDQRATVVVVASEVHDIASGTGLPDPAATWPVAMEDYDRVIARGETVGDEGSRVRYSRSKLCNVLFAAELARRLSGATTPLADPETLAALAAVPGGASCTLPGSRSIRVVSLNPGAMLGTSFIAGIVGPFAGWILVSMMSVILPLTPFRRLLRDVKKSGPILAKVATGECCADVPSGSFISDGEAHAASAFARSPAGAAVAGPALWDKSLQWAGVTAAELKAAGF